MTFLTSFLSVLLPAWRVSDGGWPFRIKGSTILGYTLCVLSVFGTTYNCVVALVVGGLYGRCLTAGYNGWDMFKPMLIRPWPSLVAGVFLCGLTVYDVYPMTLGTFGFILIYAANVCQPWLRPWVERQDWPGHSNRYVEGLEALAVAIAVAALAVTLEF